MLIAGLAIALLIGIASAALLDYYGRIQTTVSVGQSVLLDDKDVSQPISETVSAYGGETVCKYHWLRNRASVPISVQLNSWAYGGIPDGVTIEYYALKSTTWHVLANLGDDNRFNDVEAYVTKTDKCGSVEFKVEIVSENPNVAQYGMGIAISTNKATIDFQVFYREWQEPYGWYYQKYPWDTSPVIPLAESGTGITATGERTGKVFTVEIPVELLGGYGATYYFAMQFRTNLLGTYPEGINLWAQTNAELFADATVGITGPITLQPGEVLWFCIRYKFKPNFVGEATIYTDIIPPEQ
jgi:hypothetical protein